MGNEQSAMEPRERNRLQKPRTNRHLPADGYRASQLRESKSILVASFIESKASISRSDTGGTLDKQELQRRLTAELLEPSAMPFANDRQAENNVGEHNEASQDLRSSVHRCNSLDTHQLNARESTSRLLQAMSGPQLSPGMDNVPGERKSTISLFRRLGKDTANEDLVSPQYTIEMFSPHDAGAAGDVRRQSDNVDPMKLIRRRSFATPGLATRIDRTARSQMINPLRSHPVNDDDWQLRTMWIEDDIAEPPPLDRLVGMQQFNSARYSSNLRATTPGEMDYSHTGAFQLGSLFVMNGAASPEPSEKSTLRMLTPRQSFHTLRDEDYFTASEGARTPPRQNTPSEVRSLKLRQKMTTKNVPSIPQLAHDNNSKNLNFSRTRPVRRPRTPRESRRSNHTEDSTPHDMKQAPPQNATAAPMASARRSASHFARGYLSELPTGPYSDRRSLSVNTNRQVSQESTSQYSQATDDEGFDEPRMEQTVEINRHDSKLSKHQPEQSYVELSPPPSPIEGLEYFGEKTPVAPARPKQTTADSGYSSNSSTRGLPTSPEERDGLELVIAKRQQQPLVPRDCESRLSHRDDTQSLYSFEQMLKEKPPAPASIDGVTDVSRSSAKPERMSILQTLSWGRPWLSLSPVPSTDTVSSSASAVSSKSKPEVKPKQEVKPTNKLQKTRPRNKSLIRVQGLAPVDGHNVPRVPSPIVRKHSSRLLNNPGMDHIEHTYGLTADEDIELDPALFDQSFVIRFPSPTPEADLEDAIQQNKRKKRKSRRMSKAAKSEPGSRPSSPPPLPRTGVAALFWRDSRGPTEVQRMASDNTFSIADFGTAAQALGDSPYDVAHRMSGSAPRPSFSQAESAPVAPHQMSTNMMRPKSWIEWDDQAASEFARMRSRERAAIAEAREANARYLVQPGQWPALGQRSHSYHEDVPDFCVPSDGSMHSLRRSSSFHSFEYEPQHVPRRTSTVTEFQRRGRPKSFQEWEFNRRNSARSRSRPRGGVIEMAAPPVPPLPAQTLEREEEQFFSATAPRNHIADQLKKKPSHGRNKSDTTPDKPDWDSSGDLWKQRRIMLSQNLQLYTENGTVQPLPAKKKDAHAKPQPSTEQRVGLDEPEDETPPAIVVSRYITPSPTQGLFKHAESQPPEPKGNSPGRDRSTSSPTPPSNHAHAASTSSSAPSPPRDVVESPSSVLGKRKTPIAKATPRHESISSITSMLETAQASVAVVDRYGGRLAYEYQPGRGVGGSAGTRPTAKCSSVRRSGALSQEFGVDLSDVPVLMVQKATPVFISALR